MPEAIPLFEGQDEEVPSFLDTVSVQPTFEQTFKASGMLGHMDTSVMSLARMQTLSEAEEKGEVLSVQALNERYKDYGVKFDAPTTDVAAELIAQRHQDKRELETVIASGPQGFFYDAARFVGGMVPHALDPIDATAGFLTGGLLNIAIKGARLGKLGASATRVAKSLGPELTAAQKFALGATEGAVGNLAVEPLVFAANEKEMMEYTMADSFLNAVGGAVGFAGIRYSAGKGVNLLKRFPDLHARVAKSAISMMKRGKLPRVNLFIDKYADEVFNAKNPNLPEYTHKPISVSEVKENTLYVPKKSAGAKNAPIGDDYGDGVYITDNPHVAHGHAANSANDTIGNVVEVKYNDGKLLDLDQKIDSSVRANLKDALPADFKIKDGETLKQVFERLRNSGNESAIPKFNEAVKQMGFDGYKHEANSFMGRPHKAHNEIILFDAEKLNEVSKVKANENSLGSTIDEKIKKEGAEANSIKNNFGYDEEVHGEFKEIIDKQVDSPEVRQWTEYEQGMVDELDRISSDESIDPVVKQELEAIKERAKIDELEDVGRKAGISCYGRFKIDG